MKASAANPSLHLYTRLLFTDVLNLLRHVRTPLWRTETIAWSVSINNVRDRTVIFPSLKFSLFMHFISSSEKRDNLDIILYSYRL